MVDYKEETESNFQPTDTQISLAVAILAMNPFEDIVTITEETYAAANAVIQAALKL